MPDMGDALRRLWLALELVAELDDSDIDAGELTYDECASVHDCMVKVADAYARHTGRAVKA